MFSSPQKRPSEGTVLMEKPVLQSSDRLSPQAWLVHQQPQQTQPEEGQGTSSQLPLVMGTSEKLRRMGEAHL